ncbi:MAG: alpha/beta hydrolase [Planctomycetota bacterium]|nr:alpha/beta hydrolase [Planctomycetota bacterium]
MTITLCCCALLLMLALARALPGSAAEPAAGIQPDLKDHPYGPNPRHVLDLYKAPSTSPTPLVVFIHGGGFLKGDKTVVHKKLELARLLQAGISCASINYRFSSEAICPASMQDGARAVQYLRGKAGEWNLDPERFACSGGSAGAGISMWIGFRDDQADPRSADPVARASTRLACVAVFEGQCSYDPRWIKDHLPEDSYLNGALPKLFGIRPDEILNPPAEKARLMEESAALNLVSASAPPTYLVYSRSLEDPKGDIHHPNHGKHLKAKMDRLGVECVLVTEDNRARMETLADFLIRQLKGTQG